MSIGPFGGSDASIGCQHTSLVLAEGSPSKQWPSVQLVNIEASVGELPFAVFDSELQRIAFHEVVEHQSCHTDAEVLMLECASYLPVTGKPSCPVNVGQCNHGTVDYIS